MSKTTLHFLVQGSAKLPYEVTLIRDGNRFRSKCTCPAGDKKQLCKHVTGLIDYMTNPSRPEIVSDNEPDAYDIEEMFTDSDAYNAKMDYETAAHALREKEKEIRKMLQPLEDAVKQRKKALQRILSS